jgi:hypothetical protein
MSNTRKYTFDIDTKRYLNRVNVYRQLNGLDKIANIDAVDIDNFVIGLKDLGLWTVSSFWLLRTNQNVGVGTLVVGSGGAGSYDGTLLNSITLSANGIQSTANTQHMLTNFPLVRALTTIASYKVNINPAGNRRIISSVNNGSWFGMTAAAQGGELFGSAGTLTLTFPSTNVIGTQTFDAVTFGASSIPYRNGANGSAGGIFYPTLADDNLTIFRPSTTFINATVSFAMTCLNNLSLSQLTSLNNLYKATIGKGLGLP